MLEEANRDMYASVGLKNSKLESETNQKLRQTAQRLKI